MFAIVAATAVVFAVVVACDGPHFVQELQFSGSQLRPQLILVAAKQATLLLYIYNISTIWGPSAIRLQLIAAGAERTCFTCNSKFAALEN